MDNVELLDLCRICLCDGPSVPIFGSITGDWPDISNELTLCFGEKINDLYGFPRNICESCRLKVTDTVTLINKYKESQQVLVNVFTQTKEEIVDFNEDHFDDGFDIYEENDVKSNIKLEAIVFDDAQQFHELIKPLAKNITKNQTILNKKTNQKIKKESKNVNKKSIDSKSIANKKKRGKKTDVVKTKVTNSVIAKAILEGEFSFKTGQWSYQRPDKKKTIQLKKRKENYISINDIIAQKETSELESTLCEQCGQKFETKEQLARHKYKKHIEQLPEKCDVCGKICTNKRNLKRHQQRIHWDKNFMCNICGQRFAVETLLKEHNKRTHTNGYYKKHPCKICGKLLCNAKYLLIHERSVHTGERPAICSVCGKGYLHEDYLRDHMRIHTGERPYKCPVCGRGYAQKCNMKSHIKHNHRLSDLDADTRSKVPQRFFKYMKP